MDKYFIIEKIQTLGSDNTGFTIRYDFYDSKRAMIESELMLAKDRIDGLTSTIKNRIDLPFPREVSELEKAIENTTFEIKRLEALYMLEEAELDIQKLFYPDEDMEIFDGYWPDDTPDLIDYLLLNCKTHKVPKEVRLAIESYKNQFVTNDTDDNSFIDFMENIQNILDGLYDEEC